MDAPVGRGRTILRIVVLLAFGTVVLAMIGLWLWVDVVRFDYPAEPNPKCARTVYLPGIEIRWGCDGEQEDN